MGLPGTEEAENVLGRIQGGVHLSPLKLILLPLPRGVPKEKEERLFGRPAEVSPVNGRHDVRVAVQEPHELLQAPETALAGAEHALQCAQCYSQGFAQLLPISHLDDRVVLAVLLEPLLYELDHDADEPDDGDDGW